MATLDEIIQTYNNTNNPYRSWCCLACGGSWKSYTKDTQKLREHCKGMVHLAVVAMSDPTYRWSLQNDDITLKEGFCIVEILLYRHPLILFSEEVLYKTRRPRKPRVYPGMGVL